LNTGWGIPFWDKTTPLKALTVRRWKDGTLLDSGKIDESHGSSFAIHRADLQSALVNKALSLGNVKLRVSAPVVDVQFDRAAVTLGDGTVIEADAVLGADGIRSVVRTKLLDDSSVKAYPTGDAAYRILIPRSKMMTSPELQELIDSPRATRWVGPDRHIVGYPVRNGELYNLALLHPDHESAEESWTTRGSRQAMIDDYVGWDGRITQMLSHVEEDEVLEWRLNLYMPLKTWTRGSVALLGDACHPML
jgi:salicylate hydroxylase